MSYPRELVCSLCLCLYRSLARESLQEDRNRVQLDRKCILVSPVQPFHLWSVSIFLVWRIAMLHCVYRTPQSWRWCMPGSLPINHGCLLVFGSLLFVLKTESPVSDIFSWPDLDCLQWLETGFHAGVLAENFSGPPMICFELLWTKDTEVFFSFFLFLKLYSLIIFSLPIMHIDIWWSCVTSSWLRIIPRRFNLVYPLPLAQSNHGISR